ncbi:MAG: radical SAM protein [Nitrospirae bacterium]|nr:radical SAM protein [Nitrospirota bacterium]
MTTLVTEQKKVESASDNIALKGFCAAPWVEAVLYNSGHLLTCCRNSRIFGNWQEKGLENCWHSEEFQKFRKSIVLGNFPNEECKNCYYNGTSRPLKTELFTAFHYNAQIINEYFGHKNNVIYDILPQFDLKSASSNTGDVLEKYFTALDDMERKKVSYPVTVSYAINKLRVIGSIAKAFIQGDLHPPVVGAFRQVELTNRCNARCVMCPGKYAGTIVNGCELDERHLKEAFSRTDDIIDFFMNGTEFLFYKNWQKVADYLVNSGIKLSLSTNGILLSPHNIRYLIDKKIPLKLNISMDGATKETLESTRINVNYDKLLDSIKYLLSYASQKKHDFYISFSFVLMKKNYHELPQLIKLAGNLMNGKRCPNFNKLVRKTGNFLKGLQYPVITKLVRFAGLFFKRLRYPSVSVLCQALETYNVKTYREFVYEQHHTLIEKEKLKDVFKKALHESTKAGVRVEVFYSYGIEDFIKQDFPFPPLVKQ